MMLQIWKLNRNCEMFEMSAGSKNTSGLHKSKDGWYSIELKFFPGDREEASSIRKAVGTVCLFADPPPQGFKV